MSTFEEMRNTLRNLDEQIENNESINKEMFSELANCVWDLLIQVEEHINNTKKEEDEKRYREWEESMGDDL